MKTVTLKNCIRFVSILLMAGSQSLFGQVTNTNTGLMYSGIQAAIDDPLTLNGHTLVAAPGVYVENVLVYKELTINGPKMGVDGNHPSRGTGEAIIHPAIINFTDGIFWASGGKIFNITADNVTIDGFTLDGDNPDLASGYIINGASPDCESGISSHGGYDGADPDLAGDNLVLQNNIIKNLMGYGIIMWSAASLPTTQSSQILHNKFQNILYMGIQLAQNYYATIEYNTMSILPGGLNIYWYWMANTSSNPGRISNNIINLIPMERNDGYSITALLGIHMIFLYNGISDAWEVTENAINNTLTRSSGSHGIVVSHCEGQSLLVHNNTISKFENGYLLHSSVNFWTPGAPAAISGGTVSNCTHGVAVINLSEWVGDNPTDHYKVDGLTIQNSTVAGVFAASQNVNYDAGFGFNTPTKVYVDVTNCKISGETGIFNEGNLGYVFAHENDLSSNSNFAIDNQSSNTVEATCNWYGHWTGPINDDNPGGMGAEVSGPAWSDPWVTSGVDDDPGQPGFQPEPGSCVPIKCGNNNQKFLFCHNAKTKCVGYEDALIHIAHGDPFGACPGEFFISGPGVPETIEVDHLTVSSFPNPFTNSTTIKYGLGSDGKVSIKVYDALGQEVASLINSERKAGVYTTDFDASALDNGVYYYVVIANASEKEYVQTGKLIKL